MTVNIKKTLFSILLFLIISPFFSQVSINLCTGTTTTNATSGSVYDSGGPSGNYLNSENCQLLINPGCAATISISFSSFNTESCCDFLRIYNGPTTASPLLGNFAGSTLPGTIVANAGQMLLFWSTDGSVVSSGFAATWTAATAGTLAPVANFSMSTTNPMLNTNMAFTDQTTNLPNSWFWQFGDGNTSTSQNPVHSYLSSGLKTVTLSASNCSTTSIVTKTLLVQSAPNMVVSPTTVSLTSNSCADSIAASITISNTGSGGLTYNATFGADSIKVLVCTYGVDMTATGEYIKTLNAISTYFNKYSVTQYSGNTASGLQTAMTGKHVVLFPRQISLTDTHYSTYSTALNTFVTNGGSVIFCGSSNFVGYLRPFNTGLFTGSYGGSSSTFSINNILPNDSLMYGLGASSFTAPANTNYLNVTSSGKVTTANVGTWDVVFYRNIGTGKAIFIGSEFTSPSAAFSYIIARAVRNSVTGNLVSSTANPNTGTLTTSQTQTVNLMIKPGANLAAGTYTYNLVITNNGSTPSYTVPCLLTVGSNPCSDFSFINPNVCTGVVSFSNNIANPVTSYSWNFGNSTSSTLANPTCIYTSPGTYSVTLTVCSGTFCSSRTKTLTIVNVGGPVSASCTPVTTYTSNQYGIINVTLNTINKTSGYSSEGNLDFSCTNQTTLSVGTNYTINITTNYLYNENVYVWIDYNNDGILQSSEQVMSSVNKLTTHTLVYTPPTSGVVLNTPLRMRVIDDYYAVTGGACQTLYYGQSEDYTVRFQPNTIPPNANFSFTSNSCSGIANFSDLSTNNPTSWLWNFGDSNASGSQNPSHTYTTSGTFTVTLIASNAYGSSFYTQTITVNPLVFNIGYSGSANVGSNLTFTTSLSGGSSYVWNFGDGAFAGSQTSTHTYTASGTYTVQLNILSGSCSNTQTMVITVAGPLGINSILNESSQFAVFPNPFSENVNIKLNLKSDSKISIKVINPIGEVVENILNDEQVTSGEHLYRTGNLAEGLYFVFLTMDNKTYSYKITSMKQ